MDRIHSRAHIVQLPEHIGKIISAAVEHFAAKNGLALENWHQDEPFWYVWEEEKTSAQLFIKSVQVTPFETKDGLQLVAMPFAQVIDEEKGEGRWLEEVPKPKNAERLSLRMSIEESQVSVILEAAWQRAKEITIGQISQEKVGLSPKPKQQPS